MTVKTIYIDENNKSAKAFLSYVSTLDFVKIEENTIPKSQINETRRRIALINSGEIKTRSWDEAKREIFD